MDKDAQPSQSGGSIVWEGDASDGFDPDTIIIWFVCVGSSGDETIAILSSMNWLDFSFNTIVSTIRSWMPTKITIRPNIKY